jgi:hypothetical protein
MPLNLSLPICNRCSLQPALRVLAERFLNRTIQGGDKGHDSVEDARATMDLTQLKIQNGEKALLLLLFCRGNGSKDLLAFCGIEMRECYAHVDDAMLETFLPCYIPSCCACSKLFGVGAVCEHFLFLGLSPLVECLLLVQGPLLGSPGRFRGRAWSSCWAREASGAHWSTAGGMALACRAS